MAIPALNALIKAALYESPFFLHTYTKCHVHLGLECYCIFAVSFQGSHLREKLSLPHCSLCPAWGSCTGACAAGAWEHLLSDELIYLQFIKRKTRHKKILQSSGALCLLLAGSALAGCSITCL